MGDANGATEAIGNTALIDEREASTRVGQRPFRGEADPRHGTMEQLNSRER